MMTIKEQFISEIKERIALQKDLLKREEDSARIEGSIDALQGLLNSMDSLESEKPMQEGLEAEIPNDLEEAAKEYALDTAEDSEQYSARYLGYKDGAKWQKEQDDKELSEKIAAAYQLGVKDKEQKFVDGLDEAANVYSNEHNDDCFDAIGSVCPHIIEAFIAGAKWQKQHDAELIEIAYNDGITIGMTKQKEQMLKEAVEGEVTTDNRGNNVVRAGVFNKDFEYGDKVRVIIVKEDEK